MKSYFLCFFIFISTLCKGITINHEGTHLDSIPKDGLKIKNGWKFHFGDNPNWVKTNFDDTNWSSINLEKSIKDLPEFQKNKIVWLRLKLLVGKNLKNKTIALLINQEGASEIYFNGILIRKFGQVNTNPAFEKQFNPQEFPITIQLNAENEQYIFVKFSNSKIPSFLTNHYFGFYLPTFSRSLFDLTLSEPQNVWENYKLYHISRPLQRAVIFGVFVILFILQFLIYLNSRERKINLWLSLFCLFQAFTFLDFYLEDLEDPIFFNLYVIIFSVAGPITFLFFLLTSYDLYNEPKKIFFKFLVIFCISMIPSGLFNNYIYIFMTLGTLIYTEILRIGIKAYRAKKTGSTFFLSGQLIATFFYISFNLFYNIPFISNWIILNHVSSLPYSFKLIQIDIAFLTPAITISILLAREFAQNLVSLKHRLKEVETLSARNLQQEIEKQQLLASQNELLENQVNERTEALQQSLNHLKATQTQLIQSEKMASLGELTAGIAHEIQNPLNFVNNFSEVNKEMIEELEDELKSGNIDDALLIAADIKQNEEKINHHGKRADAIVKGMLEHSRAGSGTKEPTDINKLADEYLRLSYHGLRAKDKTFNAEMVTNFDEKLPLINVIPQDIGRVMLNLFNNAFYAVNQKAKTAGADYNPTVVVETFYLPHLEVGGLKVKDNGIGIPEHIKDKIMQPFFTTKPTGEGTGLGLSLSYDMVVKGHGGKIEVESKDGEGSEFVIQLPIA